jgi:hypothetical protein
LKLEPRITSVRVASEMCDAHSLGGNLRMTGYCIIGALRCTMNKGDVLQYMCSWASVGGGGGDGGVAWLWVAALCASQQRLVNHPP